MKRRMVLIDRDGTIIREMGFLADPRKVHLLKGSAEGIRLLNKAGFKVVIVTNQSGIGRGYYTEARARWVSSAVVRALARRGAKVHDVEYCPHHPKAEIRKYRKRCSCRKPGVGMAVKAANKLKARLRGSPAIGDRLSDVKLGLNLGGPGILVMTGYGKRNLPLIRRERIRPTVMVRNLKAAARWLVGSGR
jgi:D-glycero-D-manno-heptose 1,7-bisphosphate phosphatase